MLWKNVRGLFYTLDKERKVRAGLQADGSSDLIGFKRIKITAEDIGKTYAVICAIEVKTPTGAVKPEQRRYIDFVLENGGYAGIARSPEDAKKIISDP